MYTIEIYKIRTDVYRQVYNIQLPNLEDMAKFLETYNLCRQNQPIPNKETGSKTENLHAALHWEAGRLTTDLHLFLLFSKSKDLTSSLVLQKTICCSLAFFSPHLHLIVQIFSFNLASHSSCYHRSQLQQAFPENQPA